MPQLVPPVPVFYSYAPEDEKLRSRLVLHLRLLEREGWICQRHDHFIPARIDSTCTAIQTFFDLPLIFLLISPDFIASHRCYEVEMPYALQRHRSNTARVIPIILRPCDWQTAPFAELTCLPYGGKSVTEWSNRDRALSDIAQSLRSFLKISS